MSEQREIERITEWLGPVDMEAVLAQATIPAQAQAVESISAAAMAYAKEKDDYGMFISAWRVYVLARRRTTELVLPYIHQGRPGKLDMDVKFLSDFNITYKQWSRRVREFEIELEMLNAYFDECVSNGWNPSIAGLIKSVHGAGSSGDDFVNLCNRAKSVISELLMKHNSRLNEDQRIALLGVTDAFQAQRETEAQ